MANNPQDDGNQQNELEDVQGEKPSSSEPLLAEEDDDTALESIDQLLSEEDPELARTLSDLNQDLEGQDVKLELVDLDENSVPGAEGPESEPNPSRLTRLFTRVPLLARVSAKYKPLKKIGRWGRVLGQRLDQGIDKIWLGGIFFIKELPSRALGLVRHGAGALGSFILRNFRAFRSLERQQVLKALAGVLVLSLCIALLWKIWMGDLIPQSSQMFAVSLFEKAVATVEYDHENEVESFYHSLRHTQSIILLDKMIVNLRRSEGSGPTPMGVFEYFVEGSNRDVLIEIEARKLEMHDHMLRALEDMSYSETLTPPGKERMARALVAELNRHLTRGRVRSVYLKTFIIKP